MANVKIVLNKEGVRALLKSPEVEKMCMDIANQTVAKCGEGYEAQVRHYPERTAAAILPMTYQAKKDNLENNTILKALR